jgi:hypothetical protein
MFPIYGFIRNGWPIVIDYASDPTSVTTLSVSVGGQTWTTPLESGRHLVKVIYDGGAAPDSAVALIAVQAAAPSDGGTGDPRRVEVNGIGAGPRAVGSVAIEDLNFAVSGQQIGGDYARFGYRTSSEFNKVTMEILRYGLGKRDGRRLITVDTIAQYRVGSLPPGTFGPRMWDGREQTSAQASHGVHRLQVRGWEVDGDESWVSAISDQAVRTP